MFGVGGSWGIGKAEYHGDGGGGGVDMVVVWFVAVERA